jgi:hypothetical protein
MSTTKKCFIIMPISDQDGYEKGHFTRVYQHLIKPACEKAGFAPVRADDEIKTNYIVIDVIKKILDSDIVLCDLSAKNPNVLYELGLRQAFNKRSVLIKDNKTNRIFDIQGLRTIDYDANLRIDEVQAGIESIAKTLDETYKAGDGEVNSLIQLLSIEPAKITSKVEVSKESTLILDAVRDISERLFKIENKVANYNLSRVPTVNINGTTAEIGDSLYKGNDRIGELVDIHGDSIFVKDGVNVRKIPFKSKIFAEITSALPF